MHYAIFIVIMQNLKFIVKNTSHNVYIIMKNSKFIVIMHYAIFIVIMHHCNNALCKIYCEIHLCNIYYDELIYDLHLIFLSDTNHVSKKKYLNISFFYF